MHRAPAAWKEDFALGFAPLDEVHEVFLALVDSLGRCSDGELPATLDALLVHTRAHFGQEERWMAESGFPARHCHADEHAAVLRSIEGVRERLAAAADHAAARRLAQALADWFPGHADYLDAALAHWMCMRRFGGKPVVVRRPAHDHAASTAAAD